MSASAAHPKSNDKRTPTPPNVSYLEIDCANDSNGAPVSTGSYWSSRAIGGRGLYDRLRCPAVKDFSAASVSNADWTPLIQRQLYGITTVKVFLLPGS